MSLEPMQGNWASSQFDCQYTEISRIHAVTSVSLYTCDSVLGTLWRSIKLIKAPHMFDWEHRIALHVVNGSRASTSGEREISWFFWSCSRNLGYILELPRG